MIFFELFVGGGGIGCFLIGGSGAFFGVFDGHGGKYISDCAARDLLSRILSTDEWKSGARDVEMAKPWRREIYLEHRGFPHGSLRHEIAHAVAFLASPLAGYVTGTELHVNGGMYMA